VLDTLAPEDMRKFKVDFVKLVEREFPDLFGEIRKTLILNDNSIEMLYEALNHYFAQV